MMSTNESINMWQVKKRPISKGTDKFIASFKHSKNKGIQRRLVTVLSDNMKCLLSWGKCMEMFPDVYDRFEENHPEMCK